MKRKINPFFLWMAVASLILVLLITDLYIARAFSHTELDDVTPEIQCDQDLLEKSDILWVIPIFNNISIADNKKWCDYILSLNKTLGLHGVYHTYNEFGTLRDERYVDDGIIAFEECFGFKPEIFKAPQINLTAHNKNMLEEEGFVVYGQQSQITHKVYHCSDTGVFHNSFIDRF